MSPADLVDIDQILSMQKGSVHEMVRRVLKTDMTAVDVGAANGEITETMRECVGTFGHIVAVEPRPTHIVGSPDVVHRVSCAAFTGDRPLYLSEPETCSSFYPVLVPNVNPATIDVPVRLLDTLVDHADLVKLDVQGAEVDVLMGAETLLNRCPAWILEVWPFGLMAAGHSLYDLMMILTRHRLTPYDAQHQAITPTRLAQWILRFNNPLKHSNWLCLRTP